MSGYTLEDIDIIRRKSGISYQEAVALLDYHNGNVARALVDLERSGKLKPEEPETRRILYYGCDSAWIPTESWNVIKTLPLNALVLEDTCGELATDDWRIFEHNTIEMLELMLRMFRKYGCFAPDVRYYTSHMARTLHTDHQRLKEKLAPLGVTPAYDGMTITI